MARFINVNTNDFIEEQENQNTLKKTIYHLNILKDFLVSKGDNNFHGCHVHIFKKLIEITMNSTSFIIKKLSYFEI